MNKLEHQAKMMDYLYGEMSDRERREYELWLEQHPDVQQEIKTMQATRAWMGEVEETHPQPMLIPMTQKRVLDRKLWYRIGSVAAVLFAFWLFNFQIHTDKGGVTLSFGKPEIQEVPSATELATAQNQQMEMWKALLADNQQQLEQKLLAMDASWNNRIDNLEQDQQQQWDQVNNQQTLQVQRIKQEFTKEEIPRLAALMQQLQTEQQEELQLLLVEFWNTWVETRQTDLEQIDVKMTNLYQNVERNQQESEARVVSYIQNVAGR